MFDRLIYVLGITLSEHAVNHLFQNPLKFTFVDSDIVDIRPRIKYLNSHSFAEAMSLYKQAMRRNDKERVSSTIVSSPSYWVSTTFQLRLLELSSIKWQQVLISTPDHFVALAKWGAVLTELAKIKRRESSTLLSSAVGKYEACCKLNPTGYPALYFYYAQTLNLQAEFLNAPVSREKIFLQVHEKVKFLLQLDPSFRSQVFEWATQLFKEAVSKKEKSFLFFASGQISQAINAVFPDFSPALSLTGTSNLRFAVSQPPEQVFTLAEIAKVAFETALKLVSTDINQSSILLSNITGIGLEFVRFLFGFRIFGFLLSTAYLFFQVSKS